MIILTIRTDKPVAELGLFEDKNKLAYCSWQAHRQLAETIHLQIKELLESQGRALEDVGGIIAFRGPGSFTGLRIGLSVANALAYSLNIPIVAMGGNDWSEQGNQALSQGQDQRMVVPEYGSPPHITAPRK
jgi:tRNA threonylcarbamoyladenosine biosynthesis protein TsaB